MRQVSVSYFASGRVLKKNRTGYVGLCLYTHTVSHFAGSGKRREGGKNCFSFSSALLPNFCPIAPFLLSSSLRSLLSLLPHLFHIPLRIAEGKGLNAHIDEEGGWEQEEIRTLLIYDFFRFSGGIRMGIRWDEACMAVCAALHG